MGDNTIPDGAKSPQKLKHASSLADRCAGLARSISYHDPEPIGAIKHTLREASYFIDSQCITTIRNRDGLILRNGRGKERYANFRELIAIWLLRGRTEIRP